LKTEIDPTAIRDHVFDLSRNWLPSFQCVVHSLPRLRHREALGLCSRPERLSLKARKVGPSSFHSEGPAQVTALSFDAVATIWDLILLHWLAPFFFDLRANRAKPASV
jgi:hypothetical protein